MAFGISNIIGGSTLRGLEKGIQYEADFMRYVAGLLKHPDVEEAAALIDVAETFIKEVVDEATGLVKGGIAGAIIAAAVGVGQDPTAGSRHKMQAIEQKWPKP